MKDRPMFSALGRVADVTKPSNACETALRSLFWASYGLSSGRSRGWTRGPPYFWTKQKFWGKTGPHTPLPPPLSQSLDPALQVIHGAYPNPSIQMEAESMDCGAVSQADLTRVTFRLWRRLVRSGGQLKNKICFISPAHGARCVISQVKSSLATLLTVLAYSGFRMVKLE